MTKSEFQKRLEKKVDEAHKKRKEKFNTNQGNVFTSFSTQEDLFKYNDELIEKMCQRILKGGDIKNESMRKISDIIQSKQNPVENDINAEKERVKQLIFDFVNFFYFIEKESEEAMKSRIKEYIDLRYTVVNNPQNG